MSGSRGHPATRTKSPVLSGRRADMAIALPAGTLAQGRCLLSLPKTSPMLMNWVAVSLVLVVTVVALAVPLISPHDPLVPAGMPLQGPGKGGFLLGTDAIGRDILSRVLYGVRASWFARWWSSRSDCSSGGSSA